MSIVSLEYELMEMSGILLLLEKMWGNCLCIISRGNVLENILPGQAVFTFGAKQVSSGIIVS